MIGPETVSSWQRPVVGLGTAMSSEIGQARKLRSPHTPVLVQPAVVHLAGGGTTMIAPDQRCAHAPLNQKRFTPW